MKEQCDCCIRNAIRESSIRVDYKKYQMAREMLNWSQGCIYRIALSPGKSEFDRSILDQSHPGSINK